MPRAKVLQRTQLICSECGEDIHACDICEIPFTATDEIYCYEDEDSETMKHAHADCMDN